MKLMMLLVLWSQPLGDQRKAGSAMLLYNNASQVFKFTDHLILASILCL